ncbi:hypothetical protein K503DRAFT_805257 [Rhizopogon vinicolor AM-OR11-026]|uniref:DUF6533 domain-containing protein n=1 Tax=Rhizopogon vinicolor AM-OR11-026 TaxID=1314800 RepID=A0A1B7MIJ6_9AGAM|nr:hypothetical protein K503DRAFT_805257 [Rhizopogon vinicolor AM-OR11-026]
MTIVSNDPSLWSTIATERSFSYFIAASCAMVVYDSALTFGQEVDMIWNQRWSLMTLLYLSVRYMGILFSVDLIIGSPDGLTNRHGVSEILDGACRSSITNDHNSCTVVSQAQMWSGVVINALLWVIMVTRLHAMYQRSRRMLIFLIVISLALTIAIAAVVAIQRSRDSGEEVIMSGTYLCAVLGYDLFLASLTWMLGTAWEVLALCLAAWIAVKHFRELRQSPAGPAIGDILTVLIKSHMFYFVGFAAASCFNLGYTLSPTLMNSTFFAGLLEIASLMQMFILGPRLILSIREFNANVVENSDAATGMTSIAFQAGRPVSTASGGDV